MATRLDVVQPSVLQWARETAHVGKADAAKRMGVSEDRLSKWESGQVVPTINQLRKLAKVYERPLGALLLPVPPRHEEIVELPDFRREEIRGEESPALKRAILTAKERLEAVDGLADDGVELPFSRPIFTISLNEDTEKAGARLRDEILLEDASRTARTGSELLNMLAATASRKGYLTMQAQNIDYYEMRGFSIKGSNAAILVLNGSSYPRGKVFTLLHEIVHVALRSDALCDMSRQESSAEERFCDAVTAAALMPSRAVQERIGDLSVSDYRSLRDFADNFGPGVSAEAALLRLIELGRESWSTYRRLRPEFRKAYQEYRDKQKPKPGEDGPPLYYPLKVRDLGRPFISVVTRAHDDGFLSARDTASLLDVSYNNLGKLRKQAAKGRTS